VPRVSAKIWWIVWITIGVGSLALSWFFARQGSPTASNIFFIGGNVVDTLWLAYGLFIFRDRHWVRWAAFFIVGTYLVFGVSFLLGWNGWSGTAIGVQGMWLMTVMFFAGLWLIRLILSPGHPVLGIARTLVDEAIRMKVALTFIQLQILILPMLPFMLDRKELLQYKLQTFIDYSIWMSSILLGAMTVFLACGTITDELQKKQIFLSMTKPVGRFQYLAGKWIGIGMLNLLLISMVGVSTYTYTELLVRIVPPRDMNDFRAVREEVLTARTTVNPVPSPTLDMNGLFNKRLQLLYRENPSDWGKNPNHDVSKPEQFAALLNELTDKQRETIRTAIVSEWHSIGPRNYQVYRFTGMDVAKKYSDRVQLRFKANMSSPPPDNVVWLWMKINGYNYPVFENGQHRAIRVPPASHQILTIPLNVVGDDGVLDVEIHNANLYEPEMSWTSSVTFDPGTGLQVLYKVGEFEGNLLRTLTMMWIQLGFLAMLGLMAGTFLGFPVACLLSLVFYIGSLAKGYLLESIEFFSSWAPKDLTTWNKIVWVPSEFFRLLFNGEIWNATKIPIRVLGMAFVSLVPDFSTYNPGPLIADGRVVSMEMVSNTVLWVGLVSTGACALIAWLIFRKRELASIMV